MKARTLIVSVAAVFTLGILLASVAMSSEPGLLKLILIAIALAIPGAASAILHPRNPVGWLLLAVGLLFACLSLSDQWFESDTEAEWAAWFAQRAGALVVPLTFLVLVLLPDGHLPSAVWRPIVAGVVVMQTSAIGVWCLVSGTAAEPNPVGVLPNDWAGNVNDVADVLLQAPLVLGVLAVGLRLKRQQERTQLVALLWGAVGFAGLTVTGHVLWPAAADVLDVVGTVALGVGITMTLLPTPAPAALARSTVETPQLSARERDVLELVAEGLTNREIAEHLFISPVTARNHVSRILTKLNLDNRTQAATWLNRQRSDRTPDSLAG